MATQPILIVYGFLSSQPVRSVLFLCQENNIKFDFIFVDTSKSEHLTPKYKELNPSTQVPFINDNGFILAESGAILQYLSELHGLTNWYPVDVKDKAKVNFWLHWHHSHTRLATTQILKVRLVNGDLTPGIEKLSKSLIFISDHLASNKTRFLASNDHPSIADLLILPELDQLVKSAFDLFDLSSFPRVLQYIETLKSVLTSYEDSFVNVTQAADKWKSSL